MISDFVSFFHHSGRSELERRLSIITTSRADQQESQISDLLECPVCFEKCGSETFVCKYGHLICGECKAQGKIKSCPICRSQTVQKLSQFSQIVKKYESFPCSNGCGHLAPDKNKLAEHEEICLTMWRKCPVSCCDKSGIDLDLRGHLIQQHAEMCYAYGAQLSVGLGQMPEISIAFLLGLENIIVFQFQQKNGFSCSAFYLEPSNENENLFVKLIFRNEKVKNIKKILIPVFKKQTNEGFMSSYRDMKDFIKSNDGALTLSVNMSVSKVPFTGESPACCHHPDKRMNLLVCPDLCCNRPFHCSTCHVENVENHAPDLTQLKEIVCHKCYFTQIPSTKCVSCRKALDPFHSLVGTEKLISNI